MLVQWLIFGAYKSIDIIRKFYYLAEIEELNGFLKSLFDDLFKTWPVSHRGEDKCVIGGYIIKIANKCKV